MKSGLDCWGLIGPEMLDVLELAIEVVRCVGSVVMACFGMLLYLFFVNCG